MSTTMYVALFISIAIVIGNVVYDAVKIKRPVNWKRTGIMVAAAIALVFIMQWAGENLADIGSE